MWEVGERKGPRVMSGQSRGRWSEPSGVREVFVLSVKVEARGLGPRTQYVLVSSLVRHDTLNTSRPRVPVSSRPKEKYSRSRYCLVPLFYTKVDGTIDKERTLLRVSSSDKEVTANIKNKETNGEHYRKKINGCIFSSEMVLQR